MASGFPFQKACNAQSINSQVQKVSLVKQVGDKKMR